MVNVWPACKWVCARERRRRKWEVFPSTADVCRPWSGAGLGIRPHHIFTGIIVGLSVGKQHFGVNDSYVDLSLERSKVTECWCGSWCGKLCTHVQHLLLEARCTWTANVCHSPCKDHRKYEPFFLYITLFYCILFWFTSTVIVSSIISCSEILSKVSL